MREVVLALAILASFFLASQAQAQCPGGKCPTGVAPSVYVRTPRVGVSVGRSVSVQRQRFGVPVLRRFRR